MAETSRKLAYVLGVNDNQVGPLGKPRSPLALADSVPDSLLRRLKQYSGRLSTQAVAVMQERLPFFGDLEASQRASVALVVQTSVVNFVEWMQDPHSSVSYTAQAFEMVPQDLTRRIALRHSVEMVRVTMEYFEEVVPLLARSDEQLTALTAGILQYSRDLAFTFATAYADSAEARGSWDSRMEASVVDAVVRGDTGPELLSRAAALNWDTTAPATVVVGTPAPGRGDSNGEANSERASQYVRDTAARHGRAALTDVHGTWLVAIVSGQLTPTDKFLGDLLVAFSDGPRRRGLPARLVQVRRRLLRRERAGRCLDLLSSERRADRQGAGPCLAFGRHARQWCSFGRRGQSARAASTFSGIVCRPLRALL